MRRRFSLCGVVGVGASLGGLASVLDFHGGDSVAAGGGKP